MLGAVSQQEMLTVNDVLEDEDEMNRMIEEWDKILANGIGDKKKLEQLEAAVVTLEVYQLLRLAVSTKIPANHIMLCRPVVLCLKQCLNFLSRSAGRASGESNEVASVAEGG